MRKKLMFLSVALAICAMPASVLTSCDKDDEPNSTVQNSNVANTTWRSDNGTTIKFYTDGTCQLGQGSSASVYHQSGSYIDFDGYLIWYNSTLYHLRSGLISGNVMTVEFYFPGESSFTVEFYKVG